jgi:hypothetical protein
MEREKEDASFTMEGYRSYIGGSMREKSGAANVVLPTTSKSKQGVTAHSA